MRFTYSWLLDCLDTGFSADQLADRLSCIGLEAYVVPNDCDKCKSFVVAEIVGISQHPSADKLKVCKVFDGVDTLQVVCGASNVRLGMYTVLARVGAVVPKGGVVISKAALRGVESFGMLCSFDELGVCSGEKEDGIADLIGYKVGDSFFPSDEVIDVAITPNRGDCLGVYGIARELSAAGMGHLKGLAYLGGEEYDLCESKIPVDVLIDGIEYRAIHIGSVDNRKSTPRWIRERLMASEIKIGSCVVDIVNYVMMLMNRPMHAYDADRVKNGRLIVDRASTGESCVALNGKTYNLDGADIVVRDVSGSIQSIAGVIGSELSKCRRDTENIFLESAWYNPADVALTSRRLKVTTDASYRFSRYTDPKMIGKSINYAASLISKYCGGSVSGTVVSGGVAQKSVTVSFNHESVNRIGSTHVDREEILRILQLLGFEITQERGDKPVWSVNVPSWRCDVSCENDLVEEVIRIHGFDGVREEDIFSANSRKEEGCFSGLGDALDNKIRSAMLSQGLTEVVTFSFLSGAVVEKMGFNVGELLIDNPISNQLNVMRPSILPNLLHVAACNHASGWERVAVFELGDVYVSLDSSEQVVCGLRSGNAFPRNPHHAVRLFDFFDAKCDVENVFLQFGVSGKCLSFRPCSMSYLHPAKSSDVYCGDILCGYVGELHPGLLEFFELGGSVVCFEIYLPRIPGTYFSGRKGEFVANKYQAVKRDFAFVLNKDVRSIDLVNVIETIKHVENVSIFDVYTGANIPEGKVSIAVTVVITSKTGTMTEVEIKGVSDSIISVVGQKLGGRLRLETNSNWFFP